MTDLKHWVSEWVSEKESLVDNVGFGDPQDVNGLRHLSNEADSILAAQQAKIEELQEVIERLRATLEVIRLEWRRYMNHLKLEYPVKPGEEWQFTCQFHRKIDQVLSNVTNR